MMRMILFLCLLQSTISIPLQVPIIGIYTQTYQQTTSTSYIAASYVKFIEMSGAQVVPIFAFSEPIEILALLSKINGVLFTGGGMNYDIKQRWTSNADLIFKYAQQQNDQGNIFPIFGTCMGLQLMSYLTSNYDDRVLTRVHGDDAIILPVTFLEENYIFATLSSKHIEKMTKGGGLMYYNHNWAVTLDTFYSNPYLKPFWNLIAYSVTPYNERFMAAFEARNYPFYGVQFHPEKSPFEWKIKADRSLEAMEVVQIISNRFVQKARSNRNKFSSPDEFTKASIYNFDTVTTDSSFSEVYLFKENTTALAPQMSPL